MTDEMRRRDAEIKRDNALVLREQAAVLGKRAHELYRQADRADEEAAAIEAGRVQAERREEDDHAS